MDYKLIEGDNELYMEDEGKKIACITFVPEAEDIINADHTIVDKEYGGRGLAAKLVEGLVDYAKKNNLKIRPTCTYAQSYLEKHTEHSDLLAE